MRIVKKVFFFPDAAKDEMRPEMGEYEGIINYIGVLGAERTERPYFETPLDAELAARMLQGLKLTDPEYVVALKHERSPKRMVEYLQARHIPFATKTETHVYPSSVIYLAALGRKVRSTSHYVIYRTPSLDDVQWTIARYGSLDRVRVFVAPPATAPGLAKTLTLPNAQIDYRALLERCEYHALFDNDWEYFFVLTTKPHISHLVSWLRRACYELGVESETRHDPKMLTNLRGRLERLLGCALFYRAASHSEIA